MQLTRLVDVLDDVVGIADLRRHQRCHEISWVVRLEPTRVIRDDRVGDRVRLAEAIAAEGLELARDLLDALAAVTTGNRLLNELAQLAPNQLGVLLTDGFAQNVCFGERDTCQRLRDSHHLLLIGDDAIGALQNWLELGQDVFDRLLAALAAHVNAVHSGVEGTGTHQCVRGYEVIETVSADALQQVRRQGRLELEYADGSACTQHSVRLDVVERQRVQIRCTARALADRAQRVANDGECCEPEEVNLEHACVLERGHVVLRDDDGVLCTVARSSAFGGLRADRHVLIERAGCDDDAGRMHAGVAREALELHRIVEELAIALLALLHLAAVVLARRVKLADLRDPLDRFLDAQREVRVIRDQLGEVVGFRRREAQRSTHILDGCPRLQRTERDDLAHRIASVLLADVLDDFTATLEAEVDVDVRHGDAIRVEEPLEEKVEFKGINVRDF